MFGVLASILIALISLFVPGVLLSFALLKKTELHTFEIISIGFIFGLIATPSMTWMESYLINYVHFFSFSLELFEINSLILTITGLILCYREGALQGFGSWISKLLGAATEPGAGTSRELETVRIYLSSHERGREVALKHKEEERALQTKQQSELSSATFKADEKQMMVYNHKVALARLEKSHLAEEKSLAESLQGAKYKSSGPHWIVWAVLLVLIFMTFYTRILNISIAPKFFEFDPYFDMIDTHYILTYGHQLLLDPSAWPVVAVGTNHRIEPIVPYLEAYWYSLVNQIKFHYTTFNTNLMSYVGSIYPPITAALLVFIVFVLLYREYDERIGLIGAGLAATMPALISTFIAGEQLVEPWGIMALFFFIMAYMLAVRNNKSKRLAILAGIAFASSFLGAHYYTVTTGVLALYIVLQGIIEIMRGHDLKEFYKMNVVIIIVIAIFLAIFLPYGSTLQNRIPSILGIPFTISAPLGALILIFVMDYLTRLALPKVKSSSIPTLVPKILICLAVLAVLSLITSYVLSSVFTDGLLIVLIPIWLFVVEIFILVLAKRITIDTEVLWRATIIIVLAIIAAAVIFLSPIRHSVNSYIALSTRFTTPSIPLFMTVQEYEPTGLFYNFAGAGFGGLGSSALLIPIAMAAIFIIFNSVLFRKSKTGVLYLAIAVPLMAAGFVEVKYLPHFGVAYLILFCILLGELLYLLQSKWKLSEYGKQDGISPSVYQASTGAAFILLLIGAFFVIGAIAAFAFLIFGIYFYFIRKQKNKAYLAIAAVSVLLLIASIFPIFTLGEGYAVASSLKAAVTFSGTSNITTACDTLNANNNQFGASVYCNLIPQYWLNSMAWINQNVGPTAPRVLAWWDYGDWINWFGRSNAVLRGDNAVPKEDYATAAQYVLGPSYNETPQSLAAYMNGNQSKYVLFDQDLIQKWGALNFLGCIDANATSLQYAIQQGKSENPPQPYALGTSQCEQSHDPQYAAVPLSVLQGNTNQSAINNFCSITSANALYVNTYLITGSSLSNQTVCVELPYQSSHSQLPNGVLQLYHSNGTKMNAVIQENQYLGVQDLQGVPYVLFLTIYLPSANGTIINAPSEFYSSNYYLGFFTGNLPGFKQVYPNYTTGTNFVNFNQPVRIYELVNYTGGLPPVPQKSPWIKNNDSMP